jgi:hypothetical protein
MGLFERLFGPKPPAPPCAIHPEDRDLVRAEDVEWWNGLSLTRYRALEREDMASRVAAFRRFTESEGLSDQAAGEKVRVTFPTYYSTLVHREDEKFLLGATDAKLPYVIEARVSRAVRDRVIDQQAVARASSFNALVRRLIRSGRI